MTGEPSKTIERIAGVFKSSKGEWLSSKALARIQNRFGASIHLLRTAYFDGKHWDIEKRPAGKGVWEYKFNGYMPAYEVRSPVCLECGSTKVKIADDRMKK